jgi:hypothetical protein
MPVQDKRKRPTPQTGNNVRIEIAVAQGLAMTMDVVEIRPKKPPKAVI